MPLQIDAKLQGAQSRNCRRAKWLLGRRSGQQPGRRAGRSQGPSRRLRSNKTPACVTLGRARLVRVGTRTAPNLKPRTASAWSESWGTGPVRPESPDRAAAACAELRRVTRGQSGTAAEGRRLPQTVTWTPHTIASMERRVP